MYKVLNNKQTKDQFFCRKKNIEVYLFMVSGDIYRVTIAVSHRVTIITPGYGRDILKRIIRMQS